MPTEQSPAAKMAALYQQRAARSDAAILAELAALPILPAEDSPHWADDATWDQALLFLALADQASARKLPAAIPLLLERACYGDPGETMRGLRHYLERIVAPDWPRLTPMCMAAAHYSQPGARLWAIYELGILRDPAACATLIAALADPAELVRQQAVMSLTMLCQQQRELRQQVLQALEQYTVQYQSAADQDAGQSAIDDIRSMDGAA